jgi:hypothetical protein
MGLEREYCMVELGAERRWTVKILMGWVLFERVDQEFLLMGWQLSLDLFRIWLHQPEQRFVSLSNKNEVWQKLST